jgi:hypothetical protein
MKRKNYKFGQRVCGKKIERDCRTGKDLQQYLHKVVASRNNLSVFGIWSYDVYHCT